MNGFRQLKYACLDRHHTFQHTDVAVVRTLLFHFHIFIVGSLDFLLSNHANLPAAEKPNTMAIFCAGEAEIYWPKDSSRTGFFPFCRI